MVDWASKAVDSHAAAVALALSLIAFGFFLYDLILAAPFDLSIILGTRRRRWPQIAYFGCKVAYICYASDMLLLNYAQHRIDCQTAMYMLEMLMGFVALTSSALLACRTAVVFHGSGRTAVIIVVVVLWACVAAAWMQGVMDVSVAWQVSAAQPWNDGACYPTGLKDTYYVKYVITIIFDAVVLGLTVLGIVRMSGSSHIGRVLVRQGVLFFVLTLAANLAITILTALQLSPTMSLLFAMPQSTVCAICACRLYLELAEESRLVSQVSVVESNQPGNGICSNMHGNDYFGKTYSDARRPSAAITSSGSPSLDRQERKAAASAPERIGVHYANHDVEKQQQRSGSSGNDSCDSAEFGRHTHSPHRNYDVSSGELSSERRISLGGANFAAEGEEEEVGADANDSTRYQTPNE